MSHTIMKRSIILYALALLVYSAHAQNTKPQPLTQEAFEALCPTPPMGWNSWNKFGCNVSEQLLMEAADAMVASGMKDAGYEYIVVDDCWQIDRDADGNIVCDPERFPHGMKYV
ncbi:MAG: glycoside hydrolase family 27 protein, partial [Bacteroidales bacterium]|nr:glycoside hydrolase family 27 protein [Bacteroidales bacterium]